MLSATQLKSGTTFRLENNIYQVVKYTHQKIGRGGATVKLTLRNLETGGQEEKTLPSSAKVENIATFKKKMQYLYRQDRIAVFMDEKTFEQVEIPVRVLGEALSFIKEGNLIDVLFLDDKPLAVEIAPKVTLAVKETDPGAKGNSATNVYKAAVLENGLSVKVPLFIKVGDKVRIDTRTGNYVERVSS